MDVCGHSESTEQPLNLAGAVASLEIGNRSCLRRDIHALSVSKRRCVYMGMLANVLLSAYLNYQFHRWITSKSGESFLSENNSSRRLTLLALASRDAWPLIYRIMIIQCLRLHRCTPKWPDIFSMSLCWSPLKVLWHIGRHISVPRSLPTFERNSVPLWWITTRTRCSWCIIVWTPFVIHGLFRGWLRSAHWPQSNRPLCFLRSQIGVPIDLEIAELQSKKNSTIRTYRRSASKIITSILRTCTAK